MGSTTAQKHTPRCRDAACLLARQLDRVVAADGVELEHWGDLLVFYLPRLNLCFFVAPNGDVDATQRTTILGAPALFQWEARRRGAWTDHFESWVGQRRRLVAAT